MKSYDLDIVGRVSPELALMEAASEIKEKLVKRFGSGYDITENPIAPPGNTWAHEIKIRKGNKIGAAVSLRWRKHTPTAIQLDVAGASKLGSLILYCVTIGSVILGGVLAYNNLAPLAFLPEKKIVSGLGGLLFIIPGIVMAHIIKIIVLNNVKKENDALLADISDFLATL